jgi:hypothetical protein
MRIKKLERDFSVCKVPDLTSVDLDDEFVFLSKTDEEISLVCESGLVPDNALEVEADWRALRIEGVLDFSLVGVIAKISAALAREGVSVFVVSTYNTDYLFLKTRDYERGARALRADGYAIV